MSISFDELAEQALTEPAELAALYGPPGAAIVHKVTSRVGPATARFVAASPLALLASHDGTGRCDVTPRGGRPGFVKVLGDRVLAIPDVTGNRRLDTMHNVVETGRLGAMLLIPGRDDAVRVNGRACVTTSVDVLALFNPEPRRPPVVALLLEADEVFVHCAKALARGKVWRPETWPDTHDVPSMAELWKDHLSDNGVGL